MLRDELMKVANQMPEYFQEDGDSLQKTASAVNEDIQKNNYSARDLLKIAYLDVITASDMLKNYRSNFDDMKEEMEKNASVAKRAYEETGYLTKIAEFLAGQLTDEEKVDIAYAIDEMEKNASVYMEQQGFTGEKGRLHANVGLFGSPGDLIKEASYNLYVVANNIEY